MATTKDRVHLPVNAEVRVALDEHKLKELKTATVIRLLPDRVYLSLESGQTTYVHPARVFYDGAPLSIAALESDGNKRKISAKSPAAKRSKGNNSQPQVQTPLPPTPDADDHDSTTSVGESEDETLGLFSPAPSQEPPASSFTTETPESATELHVAASDAEYESGSVDTGARSALEPVSDREDPQASLTLHTSVADQSSEPSNTKADGNHEIETGEPDDTSNDVSDVTQHSSTFTQPTTSAASQPALALSSQAVSSANPVSQSQASTPPDIRINGRMFRHPDTSLANASDQTVDLSLRMENFISDLEEYSKLSVGEARKLSGQQKRWNLMSKIVPDFFNRYRYIQVKDIFNEAYAGKSRGQRDFRKAFKESWKNEALEPAAFAAQAQAQAGAETQDGEDEADE